MLPLLQLPLTPPPPVARAVVWVVVVNQKIAVAISNSRCCFFPNCCPHTKFHPNRTKNIEVKKIGYWSALVGWSGLAINSCIHFKLILFGYKPNISYQTKSNQNWMKTQVEKICHWSTVVGQQARSKNSHSHFKNSPKLNYRS